MHDDVLDSARCTRLPTVLDGVAMGQRLAVHLAASGAELIDCRVARYRHRPGERCLVQYVVTVRALDGVCRVVRVTGQWHWEPGRVDGLFRSLAKRAVRDSVGWAAPWPPVFFDAPTGMLGTTYPWDRRLPALPRIASGRDPEVLAPMLAWVGATPGQLTGVDVDTVRYREQLSAVCRYTLQTRVDAMPSASQFYVKAYPDDSGAAAAARLDALAAATAGGLVAGDVRVKPSVAYLASLRAVVLAAAHGTAVDALRLERTRLAPALQRVGTALARFGQLPVDLGPRARGDGIAHAPADRASRVVVASLPDASSTVTRVVAAARAPTPRRGLVHGDLKLEHVFDDGHAIELVDLDSCHSGDPLWDLALFAARWWAARDACDSERPLASWGADVVTAAYLSTVPSTSAPDARRLGAVAALDVAAGLVRRQEPDWRARTTRLLQRAATALAEAA